MYEVSKDNLFPAILFPSDKAKVVGHTQSKMSGLYLGTSKWISIDGINEAKLYRLATSD